MHVIAKKALEEFWRIHPTAQSALEAWYKIMIRSSFSNLLGRASLLPGEGEALLDALDENAHKHAFAVSEDLKYALREAIDLLGNEAAREQKKGVYSGERELDEQQLTQECLRLMYRLLFLFYIEARPELGIRICSTRPVPRCSTGCSFPMSCGRR